MKILLISLLFVSVLRADLTTDYALISNTQFSNRVAIAVLRAATAVRNEDSGTANHVVRLAWAKSVTSWSSAVGEASKMVPNLVANATIAAAFATDQDQLDISDNDILFVVNSLVTLQAQDKFPSL